MYTLSEKTRDKLGENSTKRYDTFAEFKDGWYEDGSGSAMTDQTAALMDSFIAHDDFSFGNDKPSIFLCFNGNLEIQWNHDKLGLVEIEFTKEGLEVFFTQSSEEIVLLKDTRKFLSKLKI